jgi:hypothetical protein
MRLSLDPWPHIAYGAKFAIENIAFCAFCIYQSMQKSLENWMQ